MSGTLTAAGTDPAPAGTGRPVTLGILGGSGYTGGELLRLLLQHPHAQVVGATSGRYAGQPLHRAHPNLRGATDLRFAARDGLPDAELVFTCLPHTEAMAVVPRLLEQGSTVIDLSADFRLRDAASYERWYGTPHSAPDLLAEAVYGLPETRRSDLPGARLVSGVGCIATATNLALLPLARAGLLAGARVVVDAKIGSSAAGAEANPAGMHAERSRSLRLYAPTGHRHAAEVLQECGPTDLHMSVHAVELVRGVLATCHVLLPDDAPAEKDLWRMWRAVCGDEPFVRVVKERHGVHRGPDPVLVAGSNFADVGFHAEGRRIVATCAIDNLVKGASGSAVQCMNVVRGLPESTGLTQLPPHPV